MKPLRFNGNPPLSFPPFARGGWGGVVWVLGGVLAVLAVGCGGNSSSGEGPAPAIQSANVEPDVAEVNAEVTIRAVITDEQGIASAVAKVTPPVGNPVDVALARTTGDQWEGRFSQTAEMGPYRVEITARDAAGNEARQELTFAVGEIGPGIGQVAPLFELANLDGETVRLADFRGQNKVVLVFYSTSSG